MVTVYLGIGSNLGDRQENISKAVNLLNENNVEVTRLSTIIETDPMGGPPQGPFLNAVLQAQTTLSPENLLTLIKSIEKKLGRIKTIINGPRTIDIDILLYEKRVINTPELVIPHPRMLERDFVMIPLKEIVPDIAKGLIYA